MRSFSRVLARLQALSGLGLAPELVVPEMAILMAQALKAATYPAVFITKPTAPPQDFTVWLGADQTVRELRALLAMGIWPGPKGTPSLQTIMSERMDRQIFAATLWGEGCTDEGPWGDLWRARGIQQGLQAVYFPASGCVAVIVIARATGKPPFSSADIEFGEAAAPFFEVAMDAAANREAYDEPVPAVQLIMESGGSSGKASFGAAEMLRDMGGGGPDAVERAMAIIEQLAAAVDLGPVYDVATDPFIHIRREAAGAGQKSGPLRQIHVARNAFGDFSVTLAPLASAAGKVGQIATIFRRVPRTLIAIRGAIRAGASARELELVIALTRGKTLEGASSALGVSISSVKTMLDRLMERAGTHTRSAALSKFVDHGRTSSW